MPLPRYVDRGGEIVAPQPYTAVDAHTYMFVLPAAPTALDRLLARSFSEPSGGAVDVRALGPIALLTASRIESLRPADPALARLGQASELEVALWVPGRARANGQERMVWFHPYMFVDQHLALAAGREVYGFPKQGGTIAIVGDPRAPTDVTLRVFCIDTFGVDARARDHEVIRIARTGAGTAPSRTWTTESEALVAFSERLLSPDLRPALVSAIGGWFGDAVGLAQLLLRLAQDTAAGRMPMLFLKQFRDAQHPDRACYQAIIEAPARRLRFRGFGFLGDYTVTVRDLESEPLRPELGLPAGPIAPLVSIRLHDDFEMQAGQEIWKA